MKPSFEKIAVAKQLQSRINLMQGLGKISHEPLYEGLSLFASAFPEKTFPTVAVHEFISYQPCNAAATTGFITAVAGKMAKKGGLSLWVAGGRKIFPAGLKHFGMEPDRIIFINTTRPKEALWIIEEALKCEVLTAVIGEIKELTFSDSRRLQLAVERSGVTAFIHRYCPRSENAVACTTRWKIGVLPSVAENGLPGVGYSNWNVELLKVRNGRPHAWQVSWAGNNFEIQQNQYTIEREERNAG